TFPPAGREATSSPSTARTPRRRSERPPPRGACGSRRPRSASSSATCAQARRSSSRRSRLRRRGLRLAHGTWRSLVAHLLWEQGVASSNLAVPTSVQAKTRSAEPALAAGSPEREHVGLGPTRTKADLQCPIHNPLGLAHELIEPRLDE